MWGAMWGALVLGTTQCISLCLIMRTPIGTLLGLSRMKAVGHFVGVIPLCENMPSGKAVKPGDVVTSRAGLSIEVCSTCVLEKLLTGTFLLIHD